MSVKVYAMNKATPEIKENYNPDFIEPAIKKSDYGLLEARCKELEAKIELQRENSIAASFNFEANFGYLKNQYESENNLLKKKVDGLKDVISKAIPFLSKQGKIELEENLLSLKKQLDEIKE